MKQIIIILITTFSIFGCKAQTTVYNLSTVTSEDINTTNYYVKDIDNHHDAIVGVWKWENGNSSFEMTLQEFEMENYAPTLTIYHDNIYGKYKYIENGVTITDISTIEAFPNFNVGLSFRSPTEYYILIRDLVSERSKRGTFILTSPTTATVEISELPGVKVNYGNGLDFALPTSMILTKQ